MRHAFVASLLAVATTMLPAQEPGEPPVHERTMRAWLVSDHTDRDLLDSAVEAILDAGRPGLLALGREARRTRPDDRERRVGIDSLISNVALGFFDHAQDSGLFFAGQYDDLRALQPEVGRFLCGLVLDTPEWFPEDQRPQVVPALRDIYPEGPPSETRERLADIARDREFEAQALRLALSYALAQWGRREFVSPHLEELRKNAGDRRTADELYFVRELAGVHYMLREYAEAADHWQIYLDGTRSLGGRAAAMDLYNTACSMALAERVEPALEVVELCAERIAADEVDSSQPLTREMFETDPDLRTIRPHPRFEAAVQAAFTDSPEVDDPKPDGR